MELAHIAMGHHIDTRYAFNDRLLFPDESTFQRIDMYHSDHDNAEAAKKAMEYLQASMYKDKLPSRASTMRSWWTGQGAEGAEHAQAGRLAAEGRRHAVDGRPGRRWRPS
jgi:hypothetical protein